ncbi:hypothetical protein PR202_ga22337 [Eleusine coracana subsp. coracana]|uniref:Fe2OG dioxygenase domain-containing protein n=1 Tax=Eleusine coracana subsp. coracana TaxID=191504 RepID=A0AAV5D404_ELECO|nr:hypothetical protein PR202_ga22337 [Eleusine coracana subsp. coracana]
MASVPAASSGYDRLSELKAFDATKAGVKGLVDAGVTTVPRIFQDPAAAAAAAQPSSNHHDVAAAGRADLVAQVKSAAETVGFFQVINHGVPSNLLTEMLASVKSFHEQPAEAKAPYYSRDREPARRVRYQSNFDLYTSPAANWRDSLFMVMTQPVNEVPPPCRAVLPEYTARVRRLGATLLGLLSEAMGLHPGFLEHDAGCLDDGLSVAGHYYPPCPEPHLTMGTTRHSDPSFLTVLLQDDIGGLQMLVNDEDGRGSSSWVDVPPVPGALVVNIGDFLQLVSNDRFKSVEHRVLATAAGPRVSVACFFRTTDGSKVYRPIVNSLEDERPRYRSTTVPEFVGYYMDKGLDGRSKLEHFRLSDDP